LRIVEELQRFLQRLSLIRGRPVSAELDSFTGLPNQRAFAAQTQKIGYFQTFGRQQTCLLVLDIDGLGAFNQRFGASTGDRAIHALVAAAESSLTASDTLYRLAGEEFCAVLPGSTLLEANDVAERIRRSFEALSFDVGGGRAGTTVSIGIATTDYAGYDLEILLAAADGALAEAKSRGRNRVVVMDPATARLPHSEPGFARLIRV